MNVKRIVKQVLKEQHLSGKYVEIFNQEVDDIVVAQMDKIAKIALEDNEIEEFLFQQAEDYVRVHLLRIDHRMQDESRSSSSNEDEA